MPVTYKDIDDLVQRQQATGAEKVPVSATEYITAQQVADLAPVPTQLSQLSDDATHRTVTDSQISDWNAKYDLPADGIPATDIAAGVIPDVSGKADMVTGATAGNLAGLDASGNLTDSGSKPSDFATAAQGALAASAVQPGDLAAVATSGDYGDLLNKPTIPSAPGTLDTDNTGAQTVSSSESLAGTVKLHKVAKTGSYAHLNNKPTIPAITLNGSATTSPSFYAPTTAGTSGYVLTSSGSGAPTWQPAPSGGGDVTDVTLGGTSVVDQDGVAVLPGYPVVEALTTAEIDTIWNAAMA